MKRTLFLRTLGSFLAIIVLATLLFVAFTLRLVREESGERLAARLEAAALALRPAVADPAAAGDPAAVRAASSAAAASTGVRITVIAADGTVLADSEGDPALMENHRRRPEVAAALEGRTGTSVRWSSTLERDLVYVAVPSAVTGRPRRAGGRAARRCRATRGARPARRRIVRADHPRGGPARRARALPSAHAADLAADGRGRARGRGGFPRPPAPQRRRRGADAGRGRERDGRAAAAPVRRAGRGRARDGRAVRLGAGGHRHPRGRRPRAAQQSRLRPPRRRARARGPLGVGADAGSRADGSRAALPRERSALGARDRPCREDPARGRLPARAGAGARAAGCHGRAPAGGHEARAGRERLARAAHPPHGHPGVPRDAGGRGAGRRGPGRGGDRAQRAADERHRGRPAVALAARVAGAAAAGGAGGPRGPGGRRGASVRAPRPGPGPDADPGGARRTCPDRPRILTWWNS